MEGARGSRQYVGGVSEEQRSEQERRFAELGLEDFFWSFIRLQSRVDDQGALRSNKVGGIVDPASKEGLTQAHGDLWASQEEDPESSGHNFDASGHNFDAFTPCHQGFSTDDRRCWGGIEGTQLQATFTIGRDGEPQGPCALPASNIYNT